MMSEREDFEKAMNNARFFPAELDFTLTKSPSGKRDEYVNTHLESCWNGWQARAAIAASQQAAPKTALTDATIDDMFESLPGLTIIQGESQINWNRALRRAFARRVEAAAAPNAELVEALQEIVKNDPFNTHNSSIIARAALSAAGVKL